MRFGNLHLSVSSPQGTAVRGAAHNWRMNGETWLRFWVRVWVRVWGGVRVRVR